MSGSEIAYSSDLEDGNLFATCPDCGERKSVHYHEDDVFRTLAHYCDTDEPVERIIVDEGTIFIACLGHARASAWEDSMAERFRARRVAQSDKPKFKLHNMETPVEVGDEWRTLYVSSSVARYFIGADTMEKALSGADGGQGFRPAYIASFETRVLNGHPSGIYLRNYGPRLDEEDVEVTRNLKMLAVDPRFYDLGNKATDGLPSIAKYCAFHGIKPPKYTLKELRALAEAR